MERRVRLVVGLLLLTTVLSLSVPLALTLAERRTSRLAVERDRQLAVLAEEAASGDATQLVERYHAVYGEPVLVVDADGRVIAAAGELDPSSPEVAESIRLGLLDDPSRPLPLVFPWTTADPLRGSTSTEGGEVATLALTRIGTEHAARDVLRYWAVLVVVGVALLLAAAVLTRALSRWAMRPVHSLEETARSIARGGQGAAVLATGPAELQELVAEFNRMVAAVQRSLDQQRRLVADASHQLRNPLAAIRLRADNLRTHLAETGVRTHAGLLRELDRLERLLDQLLSLARAQEAANTLAAGQASATDTAPLDDVVLDRIEAWGPVAQEHEQRLTVAGALPSVPVPRDDLGQVLDVLLDNATRYAGRGAVITVTAHADDGVHCVVADDGPGLPADDWHRATERFWRGSTSGDGSGLGLSIAREIVAARQGTLRIRPGDNGTGTIAEARLGPGSEPSGDGTQP
ncbi:MULTISPECIES: sensor histidine kinase [Nocardioides]|uniref:histidine kinase n=1 Tax=Nocardioides vastitatis TaxID=2568655 RepID=A0ABW0ZJG8_9ACTN|nr:HAMP domain-containing sensor histidine kinase [Nocardioides sp.]THJ02058.1 HAMP domain-containing histidine kinase [Nocardioides sp.]